MRTFICAVLAATVMLGASAAESRMLKVVGYLEDAVVSPEGLPIRAKMDTGADITSINAIEIERYTNNGEEWVEFTVDTGERRMMFRRAVERIVHIRRAGTTLQERPVVRLGLCIAGYYKNAEVTLTDRTAMSFPLLVGRKFMAAGGLVIDSAHKFVGNPVCPGAPR